MAFYNFILYNKVSIKQRDFKMIVLTENVKTRKHTDFQQDSTYQLDTLINNEMLKKDMDFPLLFKGNKKATIEELSKNIAEDFGINAPRILNSPSSKESYYHLGDFYLHNDHKNELFVLIHEYAHLLVDFFFKPEYSNNHDGYFIATYRFLLDRYDIVSIEKFNQLANILNIEIYDDAIVEFTLLSKEELDKRYQEDLKTMSDTYLSAWTQSNGMTRQSINDKKTISHYLKNELNDKAIVSVIKKCAFEYENEFSELTKEDFANTILLSPVFLMDERGNKVTGRSFGCSYGNYGYAIADGRCIDNGLQGFTSTSGFFSYGSEKEDKKESMQELKEAKKAFKKDGVNLIVTTSEKEYRRLYSIMRERYFDIR